MNYKITDKDIEDLNAYMEPYFKPGEITEGMITTVYFYLKERRYNDLKDFDILYRGNHKNLKHVYDFFSKERNINAFEYCEKHLSSNSANSHLLNFFRVSIDAKKYSPTDEGRTALISGFRHVNRADLDNLIKIALKTENSEIRFNNFLNVINKQKSFKLSALDEEKINELFIKNFPNATSIDKQRVGQILPSLEKNDYIQEDSGYFYKLKIDCDILSKFNKISVSNNSLAISIFFDYFNKYIQKNELLDIKSVQVIDDKSFLNKKIIEFNFDNGNDFESKKSMIHKLLNYCLENDGKTLNGFNVRQENNNFFNTFLLHESMKKDLVEKLGKAPKTKI